MKIYTLVIICLISLSCSIDLVPDYELEYQIPYEYKIAEKTGFNLSGEVLNFGSLSVYSRAHRELNITNNYDISTRFKFKLSGGSKGTVYIAPNDEWTLQPGETQPFAIYITAGNDSLGTYGGNISIYAVPSTMENRYEVPDLREIGYIKYTFFEYLISVKACSQKNFYVSQDLGFNTIGYWRVIKSSREPVKILI